MPTTATSPLDAAREDLRQRLFGLDAIGHYEARLWLSPLHDVADMVCRVGDHDHSPHYQCDKAGDMVQAAVRVRRGVHLRYAAYVDETITDDTETPSDRLIDALTDIAEQVESAVEGALWSNSRFARDGNHGHVRMGDVDYLRDAARALERLADKLQTVALPDPEIDE